MKRQDLLTREDFVPTRINQKFANAANRIRFYNNKANAFRHSIAYINRPLLLNIKILNELMSNKKDAVWHKHYLLGKGFSFGIYTHIENWDNKNQFAIHIYIIIPLQNDQVKVIVYK
jgi:hypothetical protein